MTTKIDEEPFVEPTDGIEMDPFADNVQAPDDKGELAVEIIDDTPEADKGATSRAAPAPESDEVDQINAKVQARINALVHDRHDERRRREEAERQRDEALALAQNVHAKWQQTQQQYSSRHKEEIKTRLEAATRKRAELKERLSTAGDKNLSWSDLAQLQDELADTVADIREYTRAAREMEEQEKIAEATRQAQQSGVQTRHAPAQPGAARQAQPQPPALDPKVQEWIGKNSWFHEDNVMQATAVAVSDKLFQQGITHVTDPKTYFATIDREIRKRFPERFERKQSSASSYSVVSPTPQASSAKRRVRLTQSELAIASRLGLTAEQYAAEKVKLGES